MPTFAHTLHQLQVMNIILRQGFADSRDTHCLIKICFKMGIVHFIYRYLEEFEKRIPRDEMLKLQVGCLSPPSPLPPPQKKNNINTPLIQRWPFQISLYFELKTICLEWAVQSFTISYFKLFFVSPRQRVRSRMIKLYCNFTKVRASRDI